jgi:GGDEF domain-containing protein
VNRSLRIYIAIVSAAFWSALAAAIATGSLSGIHDPELLAPLFGLAVAVEAMGVRKQENTIGFSAVAHLATAVLFGPVAAAAIAAFAVVLVDGIRTRQIMFILMNSSMFGIAAWAAGTAFQVSGGTVGSVTPSEAVPLMLLVATRLLVNELIFSGALAMMRASFARVLRANLRDSFGQSVGEGCLGVLLAFGYTGDRWVILPFLLPLLAALYQAQASFERLKRETKAALDAFAGVIDERDPLTTQHSERVAALVEQFVEAIELPEREAQRLVDAARFHDLGKVAVDVATLSKEGRLSEDELRAIRSHPRLSARLLAPFGFAEQMALYAELHHERYDGRGYYAVSQREIPVEAHVLIAADSYDAMTSKRAYRPALSPQEAVAELRDKAGSQFHPLVAQAFAAMIEGADVPAAMGKTQLNALRAEFSRISVMPRIDPAVLLNPGHMAVNFAALALVAFGIPRVPLWVAGAFAAAGAVATAWTIASDVAARRRSSLAAAALEAEASPAEALGAAGLRCWTVWLRFKRESFEYEPIQASGAGVDEEAVREICKRALRPGARGERGQLSNGSWIEITPGDMDTPRLAVAASRRLSTFEAALVGRIADAARPSLPSEQPVELRVLDGDQRRTGGGWQAAAIVVDLNAFENVRVVSGQLSAERVVAEARIRLKGLLRDGDLLHHLGEDRFGVVIGVTERSQVDAVVRRMDSALRDVPVPHRADPIRPAIRVPSDAECRADQELRALLAQYAPDRARKAG